MNYRCHFGTSCGMSSAQQKSYDKGSNPSNARCVKEALQRRDQVKRQLRLIQQRIKALEEAVDEKKRDNVQVNSMKKDLEDVRESTKEVTALKSFLEKVSHNLSQEMTTGSPRSSKTKTLGCINNCPNGGDEVYFDETSGVVVCKECMNESKLTKFIRLYDVA